MIIITIMLIIINNSIIVIIIGIIIMIILMTSNNDDHDDDNDNDKTRPEAAMRASGRSASARMRTAALPAGTFSRPTFGLAYFLC